MAIKFSAKDQPAAPIAAKQAKPAANDKKLAAVKPVDGSAEASTDLFLSPAEPSKGKAGKKK
jgi:hypothetical protein